MEYNVHLHCDTTVHSHQTDNHHYTLNTNRGDYHTPNLIIATGGISFAKLGATDFALRVAKQYGIHNYPFCPALVPLLLPNPPSALAGVSTEVSITTHNAPVFHDQLLFTHRGISGPAVLQISSYRQQNTPIYINFLPQLPATFLHDAKRQQPQHTLTQILRNYLPNALADYLAHIHGNSVLQHYSDNTLQHISAHLQQYAIIPNGSEGMHKAEVCSGGIDTREINPKTFNVKKHAGLHIIGEALDVTGWLGGYNLQWAWSSGWCCAQHLTA